MIKRYIFFYILPYFVEKVKRERRKKILDTARIRLLRMHKIHVIFYPPTDKTAGYQLENTNDILHNLISFLGNARGYPTLPIG